MKKLIFVFFSLLLTLSFRSVFAETGEVSVFLDGKQLDFPIQSPIIVEDRTLVPMRTLFEALGANVDWIDETKTAIAFSETTTIQIQTGGQTMRINDQEILLDVPAQLINEKTMVPIRAISEAFACHVGWVEGLHTVTVYTDGYQRTSTSLDEVSIDDQFRYPNYNGMYSVVHIFDDFTHYFGMERIEITDAQGKDYAETINHIASLLPEVQVYSLLVPSPAEFYASEEYQTHYLPAYKKIYQQLLPNIVDIDVFSPLMEHLDEQLYFFTDHHWTHRGSYYAYTAFADAIGQEVDPLPSFPTANFDGYLGSWTGDQLTGNTPGGAMLRQNPDYVERFLPKVPVIGTAYSDQEMMHPIKDVQLIDTEVLHYDTFLEGDLPLTVFHTGTQNGKKLAVIKESYGNAFTTWAVNHYEEIYVIDYRGFHHEGQYPFSLTEFYQQTAFDDLLIIHYPVSVFSDELRHAISWLAR